MNFLKLTSLAAAAVISIGSLSAQSSFSDVGRDSKADLKKAIAELADLRQEIADKKIPLSGQLTRLESEVLGLRREAEAARKAASDFGVTLEDLREKVDAQNAENVYLRNNMAAYAERFATRYHPAEKQFYKALTDDAKSLVENEKATDSEKLGALLKVIEASIERTQNIIGGTLTSGIAENKDGVQVEGNFVLVGPQVFFGDASGENVGYAKGDQVNRAFPVIESKGMPADVLVKIADLTDDGKGIMPADVTGKAIPFIQAKDGFVEHIKKGGIVMIPLLLMFLVAVILTILKLFEISSVKSPKAGTLQSILDSLNSGNKQQALQTANSVDGPFGELLVAGVENADEEKELLEEVLYERLLAAQPKLERFIAFVALTAAAAPLLGLLGTVTGMIKTFQAITVFGTGDPATLSTGISVALITTEYGLIVAIPCLLAQALLSRMAKGKLGEMEQASVAFVNGLNNK